MAFGSFEYVTKSQTAVMLLVVILFDIKAIL